MKIEFEIKGTSEELHYPLRWFRYALNDLVDKLDVYRIAETEETLEYPVIVKVNMGGPLRLECKINSADA